ncbi:MAG: aldolase [Planctomycetes bacterium]|nr:aldolase [Planctomycetota bacterium]
MIVNPVKKKLRDGHTALGHMVFEFATTGIARLAGAAGAEFVIFDMEHTGWTMETIRMLMATCREPHPVPMVRIPATEYHFVARVLDMGARGVMVPMVESAEQANLIVQSARYPPLGRRGAAFGVAHDDYQPGDAIAKMRSANEEILLIAQIETARGIENLEAIAAVPGIDVLWIGHNDLTNSMGLPGQFDHPRYVQAVQSVLDAARRHGKSAGFMATSIPMGQTLLQQGFRILAYGGDLWLYQQALKDGLASLRNGARRDMK